MKKHKMLTLLTAATMCASVFSLASVSAMAAPETESEESAYFEVFDKDKAWNMETHIDLFERNELDNQLVYPGVTGKYSFTVKNRSVSAREAEVVIEDTNDFNIPLDIRIKCDGKYVLGSEDKWVNSANYDSGVVKIPSDSESVYDLEWKWDFYEGEEQDSRDTALGVGAHYEKEPYILKITTYGDGPHIEQSEPEPSEPSDPSNPSGPPGGDNDPHDPSIPGRDDRTGIADNSDPIPSPDHDTGVTMTGDQTFMLVSGIALIAIASGLVVVTFSRKRGDGDEK